MADRSHQVDDLDFFQTRPRQQAPPCSCGKDCPCRTRRSAAPARDGAELAEAQRQLETVLASPGLNDAASAFIRSASHRLQTIAQQLAQRKAEQLEVTRAMLSELRNEIRAATSSIRLPARGAI